MSLKMFDCIAVKEDMHYSVRVLQFGEGCFLRAFVDWMIDIANDASWCRLPQGAEHRSARSFRQ